MPGDIVYCHNGVRGRETEGVLLASSVWRPGTAKHLTVHRTGTHTIICPQMATVTRLTEPILNRYLKVPVYETYRLL